MDISPLKLRPHHGMCIQFFIGRGYGCGFVENMFHIKRQLGENSKRGILLWDGTDCICTACPNNRNGFCNTAEKVAQYDKKCLYACGFAFGQILPWDEFQRRVRQKILLRPAVRRGICSDCLWNSFCQQQDVEKSVENV